jgi:hypothetical protein
VGSLTKLQRYYLYYTGLPVVCRDACRAGENGMSPRWIGYSFLFFTISMYAVIGIVSRTSDVSEYYVAGRRVPAFFNGMATGADWMSAASFIGLAGTLYLSGFQGLAYVIGWTGGSYSLPCCWRLICGVSANTPFPIFWVPAMAGMPFVLSQSALPFWPPLSMLWPRSMG